VFCGLAHCPKMVVSVKMSDVHLKMFCESGPRCTTSRLTAAARRRSCRRSTESTRTAAGQTSSTVATTPAAERSPTTVPRGSAASAR